MKVVRRSLPIYGSAFGKVALWNYTQLIYDLFNQLNRISVLFTYACNLMILCALMKDTE